MVLFSWGWGECCVSIVFGMALLFSGVSLLIFGFGMLCFVDEAEFRKFFPALECVREFEAE